MEYKLADVFKPEGVNDQEYMISIQARKGQLLQIKAD
jgi:hypothetical protein